MTALALFGGVFAWAAWALTARALYQRWAAEDAAKGTEGGYGGTAFIAMAFALVLPVALAVIIMHASAPRPATARLMAEKARMCDAALDLEAATNRLAAANDACERELARSATPPLL